MRLCNFDSVDISILVCFSLHWRRFKNCCFSSKVSAPATLCMWIPILREFIYDLGCKALWDRPSMVVIEYLQHALIVITPIKIRRLMKCDQAGLPFREVDDTRTMSWCHKSKLTRKMLKAFSSNLIVVCGEVWLMTKQKRASFCLIQRI